VTERRSTGDPAVLAYIDQATYLSWQATGRHQLAQYVWIYSRPIDWDGLRRFHANLGYGFAGRLIEPSPLPFGRHRWVAALGPAAPLAVDEVAAPDRLGAWIEERSQVPVDPVHGPGWHLAVLPMSDGTAAVSAVFSHCLLDGGATLQTITDAVRGVRRDFGHPAPRSRHRLAALRADARQTVRDLPEAASTVAKAARFAFARRGEISSSGSSRPPVARGADRTVVLPAVSAIVDTADWDARARASHGTTYALLAGFSAILGRQLGRGGASADAVPLMIAKSDRRGDADTRANAMQIATATVDPTSVTTDLTSARTVIRQALASLGDVPDETHALLPITPYVPKAAVVRTADVIFGDLPVTCSNLGEVPADTARVDGTDADHVLFRPIDQKVTRHALERAGGQLVVAAGRVCGAESIGVVGYQVGAPNTREWLSDQVSAALAEFDLKATII
jgi:hypothetical protein